MIGQNPLESNENRPEFVINGIYRVLQPIFNVNVLSRRPGTGIPGGYWEQMRLLTLEPEDKVSYLGQARALKMIHGDILSEHHIFRLHDPKNMPEQNERLIINPNYKMFLELVD